MIIIKTPLLIRADQITLGEYIELVIKDFNQHVYNLWYEEQDVDQDKTPCCYSIALYEEFAQQKCDKQFSINPKSINFEMLITDVAEELNNHIVLPDNCGTGGDCKYKTGRVVDIPKYEELFGIGEFPYINIRAFRLGNTEYFCYNITR